MGIVYQALYRAERPEVFSEILGQEHIVKILKHQIETDTVSHAYLFCGTRGTGKTTTARVLAKAVNCTSEGEIPCGECSNCMSIKDGTFMDVIEIDAASNNGVDNIRELRESVKYPPAVGKKKVYIIDEVHMLSTGAANALLKTLEEPPENVMFILATTDPQKLPATILSRCMKLDFRRVSEEILAEDMEKICNSKGVEIEQGALRLLASNADGSVRDGLSILDQCLSTGEKHIDRDLVLDFLGTVSEDFFIDLTDFVALHNISEALLSLEKALTAGKDVKQLMKDWMTHYRSLLITKYIKNPEDMLNMSTENIARIREQSSQISLEEINNAIVTLSKTIKDAKYSTQPRILLELAIVTLGTGLLETQVIPVGTGQVKADINRVRQDTSRKTENKTVEISKIEAKPINNSFDEDKEKIWNKICEEAERVKNSFYMVRESSEISEINDKELVLIAKNVVVKQHVERNMELLQKVIFDKYGKHLAIRCLEKSEDVEKTHEERTMELAKELEANFDVNIEYE